MGSQEGAKKGYNPSKKGRKTHGGKKFNKGNYRKKIIIAVLSIP